MFNLRCKEKKRTRKNYDKSVLLNSQGFAFFLFYVVLNPQVRQLLVTVWEWKKSSVTPFDEHEAIEIEEEEVTIRLPYSSTTDNLCLYSRTF